MTAKNFSNALGRFIALCLFLLVLAETAFAVPSDLSQGKLDESLGQRVGRIVDVDPMTKLNAAGRFLSELPDVVLTNFLESQGLEEKNDKYLREKGFSFLGYHGTNLKKAKELIPFGLDQNYELSGNTAGCSGGKGFYIALTRTVAQDWSTNHTHNTDKVDPISYKCPQNEGDAGQYAILRIYARVNQIENAIRLYDLKNNSNSSMTVLEFVCLCKSHIVQSYTICDTELVVEPGATDWLIAISASSPNFDQTLEQYRYNWGNLPRKEMLN